MSLEAVVSEMDPIAVNDVVRVYTPLGQVCGTFVGYYPMLHPEEQYVCIRRENNRVEYYPEHYIMMETLW